MSVYTPNCLDPAARRGVEDNPLALGGPVDTSASGAALQFALVDPPSSSEQVVLGRVAAPLEFLQVDAAWWNVAVVGHGARGEPAAGPGREPAAGARGETSPRARGEASPRARGEASAGARGEASPRACRESTTRPGREPAAWSRRGAPARAR